VDMRVATVKIRKARRRIARVDHIWLNHEARELKTIAQQQKSSQCPCADTETVSDLKGHD